MPGADQRDHEGVATGGLRRCRGARRRADPGAAGLGGRGVASTPSASPSRRRACTATPTSPSWPAPTRRCGRWGWTCASRPRWRRSSRPRTCVHSHTWYANLAGDLAAAAAPGRRTSSPRTRLEPLRPWKAEQLGGGYRVSSWVGGDRLPRRRADHRGQRRDARRHPAQLPVPGPRRRRGRAQRHRHHRLGARRGHRRGDARSASTRTGPRWCSSGASPGRRGCPTCCAPAPRCRRRCRSSCWRARPTPRRSRPRSSSLVARPAGQPRRRGLGGPDAAPRREVCQVLSHATVFVCPSVYEPLGIVNLEAMACGAAVVGTATGGIPEVVVHDDTGWLVPDRAGERRHRHPGRPRALRRRPRRDADGGGQRPGARAPVRRGRSGAGERGLLVGDGGQRGRSRSTSGRWPRAADKGGR